MTTKEYPLELENIGEDSYCLMSRGHHNLDAFMEKVSEEYPSWKMGKPEHTYFKVVPDKTGEYSVWYTQVPKETKGCIPVTVTDEAHGDMQWKKP